MLDLSRFKEVRRELKSIVYTYIKHILSIFLQIPLQTSVVIFLIM